MFLGDQVADTSYWYFPDFATLPYTKDGEVGSDADRS
jgi:hypothetical protein